jgi:hypothetical protein
MQRAMTSVLHQVAGDPLGSAVRQHTAYKQNITAADVLLPWTGHHRQICIIQW